MRWGGEAVMEQVETGMAKAYEPGTVESFWLGRWQELGAFSSPDVPAGPTWTAPCPPPNVTGALHMGHAVNGTLQDVLARSMRMKGHVVRWQPGTDHAGISTQMVVERKLHREEGKTRHDLGREAFLERVWDWKEASGNQIINQFRRLGASLDFDRWQFTMDPAYSLAVRTAFVRLFEKGLVFRGKRMINWCPRCLTSLSDLEVKHEEREGRLYRVRYVAEDGDGAIEIATVRPETILADTAVAVHPEDARHAALLGRRVRVPLSGRTVPVIADTYVDPEFGTGGLKVTPAHDPNDWEIGQRHGLEVLDLLTADGRMEEWTGEPWAGADRFEARARFVAALEREGLLVASEPYVHQVGTCERCATVIEPRLSEQWWVRMADLAGPAIAVAESGELRFHPERWRDVYLDWLRNVRDWCISRQLWWGHRIPVFTCTEGHVRASVDDLEACPDCGAAVTQDPDVLDTWFSSALWPFATQGWPEQTPAGDHYFPAQLLSTARDIMALWVARMVFMSLELTGKLPFRDVVIHATIMTRDGKRMSKSKGTGVDPLDMMEQYGTDACRWWMAGAGTAAQDVNFMPEKIEAARNFCNKVWNAARFSMMSLPEGAGAWERLVAQPPSVALEDRWILSCLDRTIQQVDRALESFQLHLATEALQTFAWFEFCDWWLEAAKPRLRAGDLAAQATLRRVLVDLLALLHPFVPFLSEEVHAQMVRAGLAEPVDTLLRRRWPAAGQRDLEAEEVFERAIEVVRAVRTLRQELDVPPAKKAERLVVEGASADTAGLRALAEVVALLARAETLSFQDEPFPGQGSASVVVRGVTVHLPLGGLLDLDKERVRLGQALEAAKAEAARLAGQLANEAFVSKAPVAVVDKLRHRATEVADQERALVRRLQLLEA
ncbi:MAG: valine--tRNA ligase [Candidatus Sericytochromatia bacterium]|nr:valine--tRNA ligase [Candidatus Sericytochromatia bacterium]